MGFSVAATAAIIGVSIIMILEVSMGNVIPLYSDIQESYKEMKDRAIDELQTMSLINVTPKGNRREITVTENFLNLFKLPHEPDKIKIAIQRGLKDYAMSQLQMTE